MNHIKVISLLGLTLFITACDSTRTALGLNRNENNEFEVLTTAPLTLPPRFDHLPAPVAKDAMASNDTMASEKARDATLRQFSQSVSIEPGKATGGETEILRNAKADENDPNIRAALSQEAAKERQKNQSFVRDLLSIKDTGNEKTLDPFEEKKRLEEKQATPS